MGVNYESLLQTRICEGGAGGGCAGECRKFAAAGRAADGDGYGDAGQVERAGDAAGVWHGDDERAGAARAGAEGIYAAGALCA